MSEAAYDLVIRGGRWFDGTGAPGVRRDLGIRDGVVVAVSEAPLPTDGCPEVIDADGQWVLPGFVDIHTHYDAEVLVNPGLGESVRHGVTTIVMGSCSLSTILSRPRGQRRHVQPGRGRALRARARHPRAPRRLVDPGRVRRRPSRRCRSVPTSAASSATATCGPTSWASAARSTPTVKPDRAGAGAPWTRSSTTPSTPGCSACRR